VTNRARDLCVNRELRKAGWRVLRVWEHELTLKRRVQLVRKIFRATGNSRARPALRNHLDELRGLGSGAGRRRP
jgi:G:T-mismatch repair DNA endonuclease (very short patch repair protein)